MKARLGTPPEVACDGELHLVALTDKTYAVVFVQGGLLFEQQSGEPVHASEVEASIMVEDWPFGEQPAPIVGDLVSCEMGGRNGTTYEQGRIIAVHGGKAWVQLVTGRHAVLPTSSISTVG